MLMSTTLVNPQIPPNSEFDIDGTPYPKTHFRLSVVHNDTISDP